MWFLFFTGNGYTQKTLKKKCDKIAYSQQFFNILEEGVHIILSISVNYYKLAF